MAIPIIDIDCCLPGNQECLICGERNRTRRWCQCPLCSKCICQACIDKLQRKFHPTHPIMNIAGQLEDVDQLEYQIEQQGRGLPGRPPIDMRIKCPFCNKPVFFRCFTCKKVKPGKFAKRSFRRRLSVRRSKRQSKRSGKRTRERGQRSRYGGSSGSGTREDPFLVD